ncbi:MAG: hypothetical protein IK096_06550 [Lachnospiraceae bacterium]|nr:hypothetical protein [Lachnospiraceae bacterium]
MATKKATPAKKTAKTTAKKPAAKKTARKIQNAGAFKSTVVLQYGEKSVPYDDLVKTVKDVWTKQFKKKIIDIESIDLYIKPEENKVYFVINNETHGDFDL